MPLTVQNQGHARASPICFKNLNMKCMAYSLLRGYYGPHYYQSLDLVVTPTRNPRNMP